MPLNISVSENMDIYAAHMRSSSLLWHWSPKWSGTPGWKRSLELQPTRSLISHSKCWTSRNWSAGQTCGVKWKSIKWGLLTEYYFENIALTPGCTAACLYETSISSHSGGLPAHLVCWGVHHITKQYHEKLKKINKWCGQSGSQQSAGALWKCGISNEHLAHLFRALQYINELKVL